MLISALTRKPLRRRRVRRARKAQGTRSLIPGKSGCDTGWGCKAARTSHLGFFDFLGFPVTPSPSSTSPSLACTQPSSLSQTFSAQSHGPGTKTLFVFSPNKQLHSSLALHIYILNKIVFYLRDLFDQFLLCVDIHLQPLAQLLLVLQLHLL